MNVELDDLGALDLKGEWVLILGGLSSAGHRRAGRFAAEAIAAGVGAVWIDGLAREAGGGMTDGPDIARSQNAWVVRVGDAERLRSDSRLASRAARALPRHRSGGTSYRIRAGLERLLRRASGIGRARGLWLLLRPHLVSLGASSKPMSVVYCDDYALTAAWYLARTWQSTRVGSGLDLGERQP